MKRLILGALLTTISLVANADCKDIANRIESNLKLAAREDASGFLDNSAPRETMRYGKINAYLTQVQLLLTQAQTLKCPVSQEAYAYGKYTNAAYGCEMAKGKEEIHTKCSQADWKPFFGETAKDTAQ